MNIVAPLATTAAASTTVNVTLTVTALSAMLAFLMKSVCCSEADVASSSRASNLSHSLTWE
jgi:hypothetical protein